MKIIINSAKQRFGGAIQVVLSFVYECINYPEHEYHVFVGQGLAKSLDEKYFPKNFKFYYFDFGKISFLNSYRINKILKPIEKKINPDCIIATSGPTYFHSETPQIIGFNLPLYIYPESPYIKSLTLSKKFKLYIKKQIHFYYFKRDAIAYVVQTDDVNQRVRKALSTGEVYTVTNNHNGFYNDWKRYPLKLSNKDSNQIRLLTISAWYPHKNLGIIPKVLDNLRKREINNVQFILTLNEVDFKKYIDNKYWDNIINVGPIKPEECPSLYDECDIMFLPTLAECFSASYPEAMKMKKPIITTNLGFAKSICGDAALYFKPRDPSAAADSIERLIDDSAMKQELISNGLNRLNKFDSPNGRARKYLLLCESYAKKINKTKYY